MHDPKYCYKAHVVRVVDGDTIDVAIDLGFNVSIKERLRLARINAPEIYGVKKESLEYKQGMKSTQRVKELVENKDVIIETSKKGKYGRYIAEVWVEGESVSDILLSEGLATEYA